MLDHVAVGDHCDRVGRAARKLSHCAADDPRHVRGDKIRHARHPDRRVRIERVDDAPKQIVVADACVVVHRDENVPAGQRRASVDRPSLAPIPGDDDHFDALIGLASQLREQPVEITTSPSIRSGDDHGDAHARAGVPSQYTSNARRRPVEAVANECTPPGDPFGRQRGCVPVDQHCHQRLPVISTGRHLRGRAEGQRAIRRGLLHREPRDDAVDRLLEPDPRPISEVPRGPVDVGEGDRYITRLVGLSTQAMSWASASRRSTKWGPMNPAPPVTRTRVKLPPRHPRPQRLAACTARAPTAYWKCDSLGTVGLLSEAPPRSSEWFGPVFRRDGLVRLA